MPDIRVEPLELADLDAAWQISLRAFANDAHTLFKMHEKGSTDAGSELLPKDAMESYIRNPAKKRLWKAVIDDRMVGFTIWGMYNWEGQNREDPPDFPGESMTDPVIPGSHPHAPFTPGMSPIERLNVITSGHMFVTLDRACQPSGPTLYCSGIHVDPQTRNGGVGTTLVAEAVAFARTKGAAMWAHLSDAPGVVKVFEKHGFQEVNTVAVNLDEFSTKPIEGKTWGRYSQHCMYKEP